MIRTLQLGSRPSSIARAIGEVGRISKSLYLLSYLDDEGYRRRILIQLERGEARHSLARAVFHGQKGELRQKYREGQEDQLGALGPVLNMIVIWNRRYIEMESTKKSGVSEYEEPLLQLFGYGRQSFVSTFRERPILHSHYSRAIPPTF